MAAPAPDAPAPKASEPLLVFAEPLLAFAARCACCGQRSSPSASSGGALCSSLCGRCGGPCLGLPQREPAPAAPPLAVRPVEDANWAMHN